MNEHYDIGFVVSIMFFFTICIALLCVWFSSLTKKAQKPLLECPKCHGESNYLTTGGICQECAWDDIVERQYKKTIDNIGGCA